MKRINQKTNPSVTVRAPANKLINENGLENTIPGNDGFGSYPAPNLKGMPGRYGTPKSGKSSGFSHKAEPLSTDLRCYFQCPETFKKDYDLRLHLKLRHKNVNPAELARAQRDAEEEIALVRRSASVFQCSICSKQFAEIGTFYDHTKEKHNMPWKEYAEQYGRCEIESAPFECKICGSVVKYTTNIVHCHLKGVHGLNWIKYLDRVRKMRQGLQPEELPTIERFECEICNAQVKYLKDHIWQVHRITEAEYGERIQAVNRGEIPDELPPIDVFQCKICSVTVKFLKDHIWNVHRLREEEYEERVRKMEQGEQPEELPSIEFVQCKVCSSSVKRFKEHLRGNHKITIAEYEELFSGE